MAREFRKVQVSIPKHRNPNPTSSVGMEALRRADLVVNKEYLYRNYKSYDDLGHNLNRKKKKTMRSGAPVTGKDKVNSYVSPFIQQSREKALLRAQEEKKKLLQERKMRRPWNDDFTKQTTECFDGRGKAEKAVIFKREPRVPPQKKISEESSATRMTRRRNDDDVPLMPSRMAGWRDSADSSSNSPRQQTSFPNPPPPPNIPSPHPSPSPAHPTLEKLVTGEPLRSQHSPLPSRSTPSSPIHLRSPHAPTSTTRGKPSSPAPPQYPSSLLSNKHQYTSQPQSPISPLFPSAAYPQAPYPRDDSHLQHAPSPSQLNPYLTQFHFEPEVVHVKTRGTSPFSSADFDKLFAVPPPPVPRETERRGKPQQEFRREHPATGTSEIEAATLRILESQTKAQEVNGEMIGKFTNLVAELGKIITHREMVPPAAGVQISNSSPTKTFKVKRKILKPSPSIDQPQSQLPFPVSSTNYQEPSSRGHSSKSSSAKQSNRSGREEILDHILQRLQVLLSLHLSSFLSALQLMESQEAALSDTMLKNVAVEDLKVFAEKTPSVKCEVLAAGKESKDEFIPPVVSNTFEISADILTLAEVGSGWLLPDGREEKRSAVDSHSFTGHQNSSSQGRGLIAVRAPPSLKHDLTEYQREYRR